MDRQFGQFFTDMWKSASDFSFYRRVARLPFGLAFRHLLKISLLFGTVLATIAIFQIVFLNGVLVWCRDNLPVITVHNGEASADVKQPYVITRKVDDKEGITVIIDTTGKTGEIGDEYKNAVLIKREGLIFKLGDRSIKQDFAGAKELTIDKEYFDSRIVSYRRLALYTLLIYVALLLTLFVQSAAVAIIGQAMALIRGLRYTFSEVLRMSFYSASVAVCFLLFILLAGIRLQPFYIFAIYAFIHISFLVGAIFSTGGDELAT